MKRKLVLVLFFLFACAVTWFLTQLFWFSPDIVVSKQTTWLTEPLADDGLPDYAAYLLEQGREGVTPENNGAIPFLQAMWPAELEPKYQRRLCKHLGMEMPVVEGMSDPGGDESLNAAVLDWIETTGQRDAPADEELAWDVIDWACDHPWKRAELPPFAEWIDAHAPEFELLHEAAAREKYYCPSPSLLVGPKDSLVMMMLPTVQAMRHAANSLRVRACGHVGEGDTEAAWKDCQAIYRLSSHLPPGTLVEDLVKIAIDGVADSLTLLILESPALTPEVARKVLEFERSRTPHSHLAETIDREERLVLVTSVLAFSGQRIQDNYTTDDIMEPFPLGPLNHASVDWNIVLQTVNECYDKMARVARQEHRAVRDDLLHAFWRDIEQLEQKDMSKFTGALLNREARSRLVGESLLRIFIPALHVALDANDRANTYAQLHTIGAALALYRLEQGEYPESLDLLVPETLEAIPIDPYGNAPVYRRTEQGYLLYSLGANGADDNASNSRLTIFEGYPVEAEMDETPVRALLGQMPPAEDAEREGENDLSDVPLINQIPEDADDWSLRLPLPQERLPNFMPREEGTGAGGRGPEN